MSNKYKPFDVQSKEVHKTIVYLHMKRNENKGNCNTQKEKKRNKINLSQSESSGPTDTV